METKSIKHFPSDPILISLFHSLLSLISLFLSRTLNRNEKYQTSFAWSHFLTYSLVHSVTLIHSPTHFLILTDYLTHSLVHSFALIYLLVYSLIPLITFSFLFTLFYSHLPNRLIHSLTHSLTLSLSLSPSSTLSLPAPLSLSHANSFLLTRSFSVSPFDFHSLDRSVSRSFSPSLVEHAEVEALIKKYVFELLSSDEPPT